MTLAATTPRSGPFSGDGSNAAFAFSFLIDDEAELVVVVADASGAETAAVLNTDYTVAGVGSPSGGTITFTTAPASTETVVMRRATVQSQDTDLQNRGSVVPQVVEDTLDDVVKMVQDVQEQVGRAILLRLSADTQGVEVPAPEDGKILGWAGSDLANLTPNTGEFVGLPGGSDDNALVRFNGSGGNALQSSGVLLGDDDALSGLSSVSAETLTLAAAAPILRLRATGATSANARADVITDANGSLYLLADPAAAGDSTSLVRAQIDGTERLRLSATGLRLSGNNPAVALDLSDKTDAVRMPKGSTGERPTGAAGDLRLNTTLATMELFAAAPAAPSGLWQRVLSTIDTPVAGDLFYVDANLSLRRLAAGSENDVLTQGASSVPAWAAPANPLTFTTSLALFASAGPHDVPIPAGVNEVRIAFGQASLNGSGHILVQLEEDGVLQTSGYSSGSSVGTSGASATNGLVAYMGSAARVMSGTMILFKQPAGNRWVAHFAGGSGSGGHVGGGLIDLGAELTGLRLTTTAGTYDGASAAGVSYK